MPHLPMTWNDLLKSKVESSSWFTGKIWIRDGLVSCQSWCTSLVLVYPGFWEFSFRPTKTSVASASTLPGILNVFVSGKNMLSRTTIKCKLNYIWLELKKPNGKSLPILVRSCSMRWYNFLPSNTHKYYFMLFRNFIWSCAMIIFVWNIRKTLY